MKENDKTERYECDADFQNAWVRINGVVEVDAETRAEIDVIKKRLIEKLKQK